MFMISSSTREEDGYITLGRLWDHHLLVVRMDAVVMIMRKSLQGMGREDNVCSTYTRRCFGWLFLAGRIKHLGRGLLFSGEPKMFRLSTVWNLPQQKEGSYGPLEQHMQELPHPSRNLTVSRVVIMVSILLWMSTFMKEFVGIWVSRRHTRVILKLKWDFLLEAGPHDFPLIVLYAIPMNSFQLWWMLHCMMPWTVSFSTTRQFNWSKCVCCPWQTSPKVRKQATIQSLLFLKLGCPVNRWRWPSWLAFWQSAPGTSLTVIQKVQWQVFLSHCDMKFLRTHQSFWMRSFLWTRMGLWQLPTWWRRTSLEMTSPERTSCRYWDGPWSLPSFQLDCNWKGTTKTGLTRFIL